MPTKLFTSGRIRKADYDPASQQLDLHWDNKTVLAYRQVPQEVYRRLCNAPSAAPDAAKRFSDLFGGVD